MSSFLSSGIRRTAVGQRVTDADLGEHGLMYGCQTHPGLKVTPRLSWGIPWLIERRPQAWDSYAREDGPEYLIPDCGSRQSHERRPRALL
jgi:hypothetical protein